MTKIKAPSELTEVTPVTIPELRHQFSPRSGDSDLVCKDPSLTQQHFKDDADINVLLERFKVTGVMPTNIRLPSFGDFTGVSDYQSAANALLKAQDSFMQLPAQMRAQFHNSPQEFMEFCSDPANLPKMREMGLANPEQVREPVEVRVIPDKVVEPPVR